MRWVLIVEDHALFREGLALSLKWRTGLDNVQSGSIDEARRILGDAKEEPPRKSQFVRLWTWTCRMGTGSNCSNDYVGCLWWRSSANEAWNAATWR